MSDEFLVLCVMHSLFFNNF